MRTFFRQLQPALLVAAVFTILCGVIYPLVVTSIGQVAFHSKANGSILTRHGTRVASSLIGENFASPMYFHPRPSAAGTGYDGSASSGSNLGPTNPDFLNTVAQRVSDYRKLNELPAGTAVPVDAVTASGSGLDPEISIANARLQAPRVAAGRGLDVAVVLQLVRQNTRDRDFGVLGEPGVNVVTLNLALDEHAGA